MRVALLTNEIAPYRVPFFRALAKTAGWEFKVFTCVDREDERQWAVATDLGFASKRSFSFAYTRSVNRQDTGGYRWKTQVHIPLGLFVDLGRCRPDVIISSEMGARTLIAAAYARLTGTRLIIACETTAHAERAPSLGQRIVRRLLRNRAHAYICNGREGRRLLESLGVAARSVFETGSAIDVESFRSHMTADQRAAYRRELRVSGLCYLYVGRLIPLKGLTRLLDAWRQFSRQDDVEASLLIVGDGELRDHLAHRVANEGLSNVKLLGFVQRRELPPIYSAADVFVLPSLQDCWAMVVQEAMIAGLPVIDSKYNGSAVELVAPGENGWIADPLDTTDLVRKLRLAWDARDRKESMGSRGREIIASMSVDRVADRFRAAVEYATSNGRQRRPKRSLVGQ